MSQWNKLLDRIILLSKDWRFDELRRILEHYRYEMREPKSGSGHVTFWKNRCMPITIPKNEPIKKIYVPMVKEIVESEEKSNENNR